MRKENSTNSEGKDRQFDWFYMMPYDIEDIIQCCGFSRYHWKDYAMDYLSIMKTFNRKKTKQYGDIRLSQLRKYVNFSKFKSFETIIDSKWLFYKIPIKGYRKDYIIQPIFDTSRLTPQQYSQAVEALREGDYNSLMKIVPPKKRPDMEEQELPINIENGDAPASITNTSISIFLSSKEGSDREAAAPQTKSETITNEAETAAETAAVPADKTAAETAAETAVVPADKTAAETSPHNIMYSRLDKKQETRDKKQDINSCRRRNNIEPVVGEQTAGETTTTENKNFNLKTSLERFFNGLTPESDDGQRILGAAGDNRRFYADNFDKLKRALQEHAVSQNRPKSVDNDEIVRYLQYCLEHRRVRQKIFDRVEQLARSNNQYHVSTDPRYPYDVLNEQGLRVSQGKVIPQDAPPKPTRTSIWVDGDWMPA